MNQSGQPMLPIPPPINFNLDEDLDSDSLLRRDFDDLAFLNQGVDEIDRDLSLSVQEREKQKAERLERNREIARNCRKRKRERIEALLQEVATLRESNTELALKLKMAQNKLGEATSGRGNRGKDDEKRRLHEVRAMNRMLTQRCAEDDIKHRLEIYSETYSDFGEERRKLAKVHIGQLEQLLLPTQISKMLLWVLKQDDEFYKNDSPQSIWNMLCSELALDSDQQKKLKGLRPELAEHNASMKRCLKSLSKLEVEVMQNMSERRTQINNVLSIITPAQTIKFLQWVEDNQACIHMLNGLWTVNNKREREILNDIMPAPLAVKTEPSGEQEPNSAAENEVKRAKTSVQ